MTGEQLDAAWTYETFSGKAPGVVQALAALGKAVDDGGLDKGLIELVKLRVSQINGCAFCIQFHLNIAERLGVEPAKRDLAAAWRDAGVYAAREQAALAWAEHLTRMDGRPVPEGAYGALCQQFTEDEAIHLTSAVGHINAWNRIAGGLRLAPPIVGRA